jgi:hypothetical protein
MIDEVVAADAVSLKSHKASVKRPTMVTDSRSPGRRWRRHQQLDRTGTDFRGGYFQHVPSDFLLGGLVTEISHDLPAVEAT